MTGTQNMLIVATSATPHRDYRIEFLNAFAYPTGHHVFFRYRARWIADLLRDDLGALQGRSAVLVFCDPAGADFNFHPIRYCKIVSVDTPDGLAQPADDDSVIVRIELENFVHPDLLQGGGLHPVLNRLILDQSDRPIPITSPDGDKAKFLFERKAPATLDLKTKGEWYQAATALSRARSLQGATLMHIRQIRDVRPARWWRAEQTKVVHAALRAYGLVYGLKYNRSYMLGLEYLAGNDQYLSTPDVAPPIASVSMPFRRFLPNYIATDLLLSPLNSSDGRCGLLVPAAQPTARPDDKTPRAMLMLEIQGRRPRTLFHMTLIATGLILQTFAATLIQPLLSKWLGLPPTSNLAVTECLKAVGVVVSCGGILFGLRQLPSFPT